MKKYLFGLIIVALLISACAGDERITIEADQVTRLATLDLELAATEVPPAPQPAPTEVIIVEGKVIVTTDKTDYEQGETVTIAVSNNLDRPMWCAQAVECGASFWLVESCQNEEITYYPRCEWVEPQHGLTKLKPGETLTGEWNSMIWDRAESKLADPGCYQVIFPFDLTDKKPMGVEWAGAKIEVYSDEFTIK